MPRRSCFLTSEDWAHLSDTELSGNGTTPRHATTTKVQNHHRWIANEFALGPPRSTQASITLLTRTLLLAPEIGKA
jgi:hypothetical protein